MQSWQPFEWIVALRFLREGRMQTAFIIGGVAIGVAVIVFMSELLLGLQGNFIRRVLTGQAHIQLLPPKEAARQLPAAPGEQAGATVQAPLQRVRSIDQWPAVQAQLQAMPEVMIVTPVVSGSALLARGAASRSISVVGVDARDYFRIVPLPDKITQGEARLGPNDLLIGVDLASDLGVGVGDKLALTAPSGAQTTLNVAGLFDLGNRGANQRTTFAPLHTAQSLMGLPGGATSLEVTVTDVWGAEGVAQRITAVTGVEADSWIRNNAQFFSSINAQSTANTSIRFFVGLSVAFGIASVLVVSVVQRSREIGILRAMGVTRGRVLRVFLIQGALLGFGGALLGCALGAAALLLWTRIERNPDGTPLWLLELHPTLFVVAVALAALTGLMAAFAPALRAARLDPVVAIRG
ncbi:ABC transporter permease [Roseateles sp. BYS78W]|uniref:ABC transporter permease n=1 Tax=Pelomonas candidula TaxID=3299025 RepID=A0ABW7HGM3_9BURK